MRNEPELSFTNWIATVKADLIASGLEVADHAGYPFVPALDDFVVKVKASKVRISVPVSIKLFQDGAMFVPAGSERVFEEVMEAKACAS